MPNKEPPITMDGYSRDELLSISQFRQQVELPLVVANKLITNGEVPTIQGGENQLYIPKKEVRKIREKLKAPGKKIRLYLKALGPGLITGASDDDPGGIGTYSSVGAQFGLSLLWMALWLFPLMIAIQEVSARIGIVTNKGLASALMRRYSRTTVYAVTLLLLLANIVNIAADLNVMAACLKMLFGIPFLAGVILFGFSIAALEIWVSYKTYTSALKWLVLSVFAYIITGFLVKPDWTHVLKKTFIPTLHFDTEYFFAMVAVLGTTLTPYLFFWQTSAEVEANRPKQAKRGNYWKYGRIRDMKTDVFSGMFLANLVFYFIIVTAAEVFNKNDITQIDTAVQAAELLRPFAGENAYLLFSLGIIGTGMLAIPVLAGSSAYAVAEIMNWPAGLRYKFPQAKGFYSVIIVSILIGVLLDFFEISPIKALYYSAFLNGVIALPLMYLIMKLGNDETLMGDETHPIPIFIFGWMAVLFMFISILGVILITYENLNS